MNDLEYYKFIERVLKEVGCDKGEFLLYNDDEKTNRINFSLICSDVFAWGIADAENLTPENIHLIKECREELKSVDLMDYYLADLFACKVRKLRPMNRYLQMMETSLRPSTLKNNEDESLKIARRKIFEDCGPSLVNY